MTDLASLDIATRSNEGVKVTLRHPVTGEDLLNDGKPMSVTVVGEHSDKYKKAQRAIVNRRLAVQGKSRKGVTLTAEEIEREALETQIQCVVGFDNLVLDGVVLTYSADAARKLLTDPRLSWIRKQIDDAITDESNFIGE